MHEKVDFLIVGQGLAGSALAMALLKRGRSLMVVDRQHPGSASRVAAGLITPLTGKGMNPAWRQREYLDVACDYYRLLERETGRKFFHPSPVVRILTSEKERRKWEDKKSGCHEWGRDAEAPGSPLRELGHGAIGMEQGAWLDTFQYLLAVQKILLENESLMAGSFRESEVEFVQGGLRWSSVEADKVILCQGAYGLAGANGYEGWFSGIAHRSAKGEILTVRLRGLDKTKRYHAEGWLASRGKDEWKAGASYDWDQLDSQPTEAGKRAVLEKLSGWVDVDKAAIEVRQHEAGVRPIIRNSRPVVGLHPGMPQVGFFNGLGSKGSLMAPAVAAHFADYLCGECELDAELAFSFDS